MAKRRPKYVEEEPLPMKAVDAYFFLRTALALIGFVLYFSDKFYLTRYNVLSYVGFMFEDLTIYHVSPIIPLIHAIAFGVCFIGLRRDIGIVRLLAVLLLFIDIFAIPVGTVISIIIIIYLLLPSTVKYFHPISEKTSMYRVVGIAILAFAIVGFFFTSGISENVIPMSESPNLMLTAMDKVSSINLTSESGKSVNVVIELWYTSSLMQSVEMQGAVLQSVSLMGGEVHNTTHNVLNAIIATVPADNLTDIAMNPNVKEIVEDKPVIQLMGFVSPQSTSSYVLEPIKNLLNISIIGNTANGKGIVVAVVDSGIDDSIPAMQRNGKSIVIDKYTLYGDYVVWHGTSVAGCIASQDKEYPGVAPGVSLLNVEVFMPSGQATYSDIIKGWEWVVNWKEAHPDKFVICSNSLGLPASPEIPGILDTAVDNIVLRYGIPMVIASGNFNPQYGICSPGMAQYGLTVGAVDSSGKIAPFSCRGPVFGEKKPDVCALGVDIAGFQPHDVFPSIKPVSGTSFSTPIVAGVLALLAEKHPNYNVFQLYDAIRNGATHVSPTGFDNDYGYGIVNLAGAELSLNTEKPSRDYVYIFALLPIIGLAVMFYPELDERLNLY
jgi:subtilisin family serine protease